ncbi:histidine phosphatase family protein [Paenibacillus sp. NPDC058174]|uniref:histidine phosphatase family protein n=1 Tax=Paenibacillus sp. NPDC058174 TaxID=3346366 RepID=UPI0036DE20A4
MKNIYVVRHCQAEGQEPDARLTVAGAQQAEKLAYFLSNKHIDYIISSPYERAVRTITPLAEKLGIEVNKDARLAERVLSGKNHANWRDMLRKTYNDLDLCYEGGESSSMAMSRASSVVSEALNSPSENIVLVSHGNLISLLLKYYDVRVGYKEWESLSNPDVYHVCFQLDKPTVQRIWVE